MCGLYFAVITLVADFKLELMACDILWEFLCDIMCPLLRFKILFSDSGLRNINSIKESLNESKKISRRSEANL